MHNFGIRVLAGAVSACLVLALILMWTITATTFWDMKWFVLEVVADVPLTAFTVWLLHKIWSPKGGDRGGW